MLREFFRTQASQQFSGQLLRGLRPEELTEHFSQVKQKISSSFQKVEVLKEKEAQRGEEKAPEAIPKSKKMPRKEASVKKTARPRVKKRKKPKKSEEKK